MIPFRWVPLVNHFSVFCCRCTLRTGTMLIAWLGLIGELLQVMDSFAQLYFYKELKQEAEDEQINEIMKLQREDFDNMPLANTDFPVIPVSDDINVEDNSYSTGYFSLAETREALVLRLLFGLGHLGVHISLLYGAWKERPKFMLPFIILQFIFVIIAFSIVIVFSLIIVADDSFLGIVFFLVGGSIAVLVAYLWAGVYTYYGHLTESILPQQDTQLQNLNYGKPDETEPHINPEEIQMAYAKIEEKLRHSQPQPV